MKPQTKFFVQAPGFYGLNLSDSPVSMQSNFALAADNCVIDKLGRLASRKGWVKRTTTSADLGAAEVCCIGELIENSGASTTLFAGNNKLFRLNGTTAVLLTYGGGGSAPTITASEWKFCQLNGVAMFWQLGHDPLIYEPAVSTTTYRRLSERAGSLGTVHQCDEAISAYGRVWAAGTTSDKQTVVWSDLIAPHIWSGGTSGSLNLAGVWPLGGDEITALAAHNNRLFIFGRKQILVYTNATSPASLALEDAIVGIGGIARDTVQNTGTDIIFLSDSGLRSMMRTIQEKSAPMRDLSKNVRDKLQQHISGESGRIKAVFSEVNEFYLLYFPSVDTLYCFDTRTTLQDGSARVTIWPTYSACSFYETKGRKLYIGKAGYLGEYFGYSDDGASYRMKYLTSWIDFGDPSQNSILKRIAATVICALRQSIVVKWAKDYVETYSSETKTVGSGQTVAEYGTAEYGIAEYTTGVFVGDAGVAGTGAAKVFQFGIESDINGAQVSIQKLEAATKEGKM